MSIKLNKNMDEMLILSGRIRDSIEEFDNLFYSQNTNRPPISEIHVEKMDSVIETLHLLKDMMMENISLQKKETVKVSVKRIDASERYKPVENDINYLTNIKVDSLAAMKTDAETICSKFDFLIESCDDLFDIIYSQEINPYVVKDWFDSESDIFLSTINKCSDILKESNIPGEKSIKLMEQLEEMDNTFNVLCDHYKNAKFPLFTIDVVVKDNEFNNFYEQFNYCSNASLEIYKELDAALKTRSVDNFLKVSETKRDMQKNNKNLSQQISKEHDVDIEK